MARLGFDVFANDHASGTLAKIGAAFHKVSRDADDAGKRSGDGFGSGLKKWFTGDGQGLFKQIGNNGGTLFGSGLLGALKTPILGPAIAGILTVAVLTALPAVGAVGGAALVTGIGAGLAGLGIMFAAKSKGVQQIWKQTLSNMGDDMRLISVPFESTLVSVAAFMKRTFDSFAPTLRTAFARMASPIENFADQAGEALQQLQPTIQPLTDAFNNVLQGLGPAMQGALHETAAGIHDLADSIGESPAGLADMVTGIGNVTRDSLQLIATLNDLNAEIEDLTGGVSAVDAVFGGLSAPIVALNGAMAGLHTGLGILNEDWGSAAKNSGEAVIPIGKLGPMLDAGTRAAVKNASATRAGVSATNESGNAAQTAAQKLQAQNTWLNNVVNSMSRLSNLALGLSGAQINFQAAIDNATQSVKDNGKTLDIHTEKGRANRTALNAVAQTAMAQAAAMVVAKKGVANAAVVTEHAQATFVKLAMKMGLARPQALALADDLIKIPNVTRTAKLQAEKRDLDNKLARAKAQLNDKDLTKERRAKLNADIAALQAKIRQAQAEINGLRGKTVTIRVVTVGGVKQDQGIGIGGRTVVEKRAGGGSVDARTPYLVGEQGQEIYVPNSAGRIIPNSALGGGGTPMTSLGRMQDESRLKLVQKSLTDSLQRLVSAISKNADKLTDLLAKYNEFKGQVTSSFTGGLFGQGTSVEDLGLRLQARRNDAAGLARSLRTLKAKGLNAGLWNALAESSDYTAAAQLAGMSRSQLATLNRQYNEQQTAVGGLGTYAAQTRYGSEIRSTRALLQQQQSIEKAIQNVLKHGIRIVGKPGQQYAQLVSANG